MCCVLHHLLNAKLHACWGSECWRKLREKDLGGLGLGWLGPFGSISINWWRSGWWDEILNESREHFLYLPLYNMKLSFKKNSCTKPWHQLECLLLVGTPGWNRCNLSYPHVLHVFVSAFQEHHGVEDCLNVPCFHPDFLREWDVVASKKFQGGYKLPRLILVEKSYRN